MKMKDEADAVLLDLLSDELSKGGLTLNGARTKILTTVADVACNGP